MPFFFLVCSLIASAAALGVRAEDPIAVRADPVRQQQVNRTVPVIGRLVALESSDIAARVAGPVDEVRVQVGDRVLKGDVLALLDTDRVAADRDLRRAELAAAEAEVTLARAELGLERQELGRLESLRQSPAFGEARYLDQRQEMLMAEAKLVQRQAAVARAKAQLSLAENDVRDSIILAPFDGVVTRRQADVGAYVAEGDPVASLIDDRRLEIEVDVPAANVGGLTPGAQLAVRIDDHEVKATVRAVVPVENSMTRTRTVRLASEFADVPELAANRSVVVEVPASPSRASLTVHKDAVLYQSGSTFVFLVREGKAEFRKVLLGDAAAGRFEVKQGLSEGDLVVIRGNERLRPGQSVQLVEADAG